MTTEDLFKKFSLDYEKAIIINFGSVSYDLSVISKKAKLPHCFVYDMTNYMEEKGYVFDNYEKKGISLTNSGKVLFFSLYDNVKYKKLCLSAINMGYSNFDINCYINECFKRIDFLIMRSNIPKQLEVLDAAMEEFYVFGNFKLFMDGLDVMNSIGPERLRKKK